MQPVQWQKNQGIAMRRPALYSQSRQPDPVPPALGSSATPTAGATAKPTRAARRWSLMALRQLSPNDPRLLWSAMALLALALAVCIALLLARAPRVLTQKDINAAVLKTLESTTLPSAAAKAYEAILPSVVRVSAYAQGKDDDDDQGMGVGTGVVIVNKGVILTNLHVIQGAHTIKVVFADGLESTARVIGTQPENDLAVLQADKIPDDLFAATMRSTADLLPGDQVMAVGFPFGIGPSASVGVVSGLKRTFRSPDGGQDIGNLIQFDAAANPGNSGGPLVTMDGEVVGIVTAILNPTRLRTFIGIGFAVPIENAAAAFGMPPF